MLYWIHFILWFHLLCNASEMGTITRIETTTTGAKTPKLEIATVDNIVQAKCHAFVGNDMTTTWKFQVDDSPDAKLAYISPTSKDAMYPNGAIQGVGIRRLKVFFKRQIGTKLTSLMTVDIKQALKTSLSATITCFSYKYPLTKPGSASSLQKSHIIHNIPDPDSDAGKAKPPELKTLKRVNGDGKHVLLAECSAFVGADDRTLTWRITIGKLVHIEYVSAESFPKLIGGIQFGTPQIVQLPTEGTQITSTVIIDLNKTLEDTNEAELTCFSYKHDQTKDVKEELMKQTTIQRYDKEDHFTASKESIFPVLLIVIGVVLLLTLLVVCLTLYEGSPKKGKRSGEEAEDSSDSSDLSDERSAIERIILPVQTFIKKQSSRLLGSARTSDTSVHEPHWKRAKYHEGTPV